MTAVCAAVYLIGLCLAGPALALVAVATLQRGDLPVAVAAAALLAAVWKVTAAAWRRLP